MSPPPAEQEQQLQCLASAFDALLHATQFLSRKEQDLQRRVKFAYEEVQYRIKLRDAFLFAASKMMKRI
jgi:hypothetical protein